MPAIEAATSVQAPQAQDQTGDVELKFPPVTKDHIIHCGYDFWFPKFVAFLPSGSRLISYSNKKSDIVPRVSAHG